jgi:hypothetical protein
MHLGQAFAVPVKAPSMKRIKLVMAGSVSVQPRL